MARKRKPRLNIPHPGPYYYPALQIEAFMKSRETATEASELICSALDEREAQREKMVAFVARQRGISPEELVDQILRGEADPLNEDELSGNNGEE